MAPRSLTVRFMKFKAKQRLTRPKAFANKSYGSISNFHMKEHPSMYYHDRVTGTSHLNLLSAVKKFNPDKEVLFSLFEPQIKDAQTKVVHDPTMPFDLQVDRIKQQYPELRFLQWDTVWLSRGREHWLMLVFSGNEAFFYERKMRVVRRSVIYSSVDRARMMYRYGKIQWAGAPILLPEKSSSDPAPPTA